MFTLQFWKDAVERALKTAAQAAILVLVGAGGDESTGLNLLQVDLAEVAGWAAGGAVLSLLFSVGSDLLPMGTKGTASLAKLDAGL